MTEEELTSKTDEILENYGMGFLTILELHSQMYVLFLEYSQSNK